MTTPKTLVRVDASGNYADEPVFLSRCRRPLQWTKRHSQGFRPKGADHAVIEDRNYSGFFQEEGRRD